MSIEKPNPEHMLKYPISSGDILNLSFERFKNNFILYWIPFLIASVVLTILIRLIIPFFPLAGEDISQYFDPETGGVIDPRLYDAIRDVIVLLLAELLLQGSVMALPIAFGVLIVKNDFYNENKQIGELISEFLPKIPIIIIMGIVTTILLLLGIVFAFVIGIVTMTFSGLVGTIVIFVAFVAVIVILPVWFSVLLVTIIIEGKGFDSLSRSRELTSGFIGKVFWMLFVIGVVQYLISLVIGIGFGVISESLPDDLYFIVSSALESIALPLTSISIFFIYLELKFQQSNSFGYTTTFQQRQMQQRSGYQQGGPSQYQQQPIRPTQPGMGSYQPPNSFGGSTDPSTGTSQQFQTPKKKFCGSCGAPAVNVDDKFCNNCGTKYPV